MRINKTHRGFSEITSHLLPNPTTWMILGLPIGPGWFFPRPENGELPNITKGWRSRAGTAQLRGTPGGNFGTPKRFVAEVFVEMSVFFQGLQTEVGEIVLIIDFYTQICLFQSLDVLISFFGEGLPPTDGVQKRGWLRALFLWLMCLLELSNEFSIELLKIFKFFLDNNFRMVGWNSSPLGESLVFFSKFVLPMSWSVKQNIVGCVWGTFFSPGSQ